MEQEEWKPVEGYKGLYEVSDYGRVKSVGYGKERILKPSSDDKGYLQVILYKNGEKEPRKVHILVMRAFKGECPEGFEVDHFDWNPRNNRLENLSYQPKGVNRARRSPEWHKNTAEANKKLAQDPEWQKNVREGAKKRAKLVDQYTLDGEFVKRWSSASDAANELGINNGNISSCCKGRYKSAGGYIWKKARLDNQHAPTVQEEHS